MERRSNEWIFAQPFEEKTTENRTNRGQEETRNSPWQLSPMLLILDGAVAGDAQQRAAMIASHRSIAPPHNGPKDDISHTVLFASMTHGVRVEDLRGPAARLDED